jgi:hypothetical protein
VAAAVALRGGGRQCETSSPNACNELMMTGAIAIASANFCDFDQGCA